MKKYIYTILLLLIPSIALAVPINLSTFSPPANPQCELFGQDKSGSLGWNGGNIWDGKGGPMTVAIGATVTISMVVSNGTFGGSNTLVINGANPPQYSVSLPLDVTTSAAGTWSIDFVTPGCGASNLTIISH